MHSPATSPAAFMAAARAASPYTPATFALIALNVLVFAVAVARGVPLVDPPADSLTAYGANVGPLTTDGQWWRAITSVFVHFGLVHLAVNMVALADLGRTAERLYGSVSLLLIAIASGAVGGAVSVASNPWTDSAGASGAIFGVLGAMIAYAAVPATRTPRRLLWTWAAVAIGFIAFTLVVHRLGTPVDHAAHLGGLASGAAIGAVLARPLGSPRPRLRIQRLTMAAALGIAAFCVPAAMWRNIGPAYADEARFVADARAHLDGEAARVAALRESFRKWRANEITRAAHARDLTAYAALLRETAERMEGYRLSPDSPSHPVAAREVIVATLRLRAQGIDQRALAVVRNDRKAASEADRLLKEADAAWQRGACGEERSSLLKCVRPPAADPGD